MKILCTMSLLTILALASSLVFSAQTPANVPTTVNADQIKLLMDEGTLELYENSDGDMVVRAKLSPAMEASFAAIITRIDQLEADLAGVIATPPSVAPEFEPVFVVYEITTTTAQFVAPGPRGLLVHRNGLLQSPGKDYTMNGFNILFLLGSIPHPNDSIRFDWWRPTALHAETGTIWSPETATSTPVPADTP